MLKILQFTIWNCLTSPKFRHTLSFHINQSKAKTDVTTVPYAIFLPHALLWRLLEFICKTAKHKQIKKKKKTGGKEEGELTA